MPWQIPIKPVLKRTASTYLTGFKVRYSLRACQGCKRLTNGFLGLSAFIGQLFRRYSADLTSTLKYIAHQLYNNQLTEIVVLRELIWKMAGIEPLPNLNDSQIRAMAGGPILRVEAVASAARGARVDPSDVLKGPQRLGRALLDSGLALPLLIQVAKQRQACIYDPSNASAHLKSLANLFDTVGITSPRMEFHKLIEILYIL